MYNLEAYRIGDMIKKTRQAKNITVEELARRISKTKTTIYKYERNEVLPDAITVFEICNALDIDVNDLLLKESIEQRKSYSVNPFGTELVYMYYLGINNDIMEYKLKFDTSNGVTKVDFLVNNDEIYYTGTIESNLNLAFISLKNYEPVNPTFEKLQLTINMKYSIDGRKKGVFLALRQNVDEPVVKKFVISKEKLKNKEKEALKKELCIEKEEVEFIKEKGFWYPNINNNNGF